MENEKEYTIVYLPRALLDASEIIRYILGGLKAPTAAERFADSLDENVGKLASQPSIGVTYRGNHKFDYEYRQIFVGNYTVFYVVLENVVEIHRIIYSARNMEELI
jgi:plasmid stabilization system protein ParE